MKIKKKWLINYTGFGKFHYMLLAISGLIYMDTAIGVTVLSFVLPAAQCDLEMDSTSKGLLTAAPMLGKWLPINIFLIKLRIFYKFVHKNIISRIKIIY